jgi:hypothetical protein
MAKTTFDTSMSLDGFMTASHQTPRSRWAAGACACTNGCSAATRPTESPTGGVYAFVTDGIESPLEAVDVLPTPAATHLRYRIVR